MFTGIWDIYRISVNSSSIWKHEYLRLIKKYEIWFAFFVSRAVTKDQQVGRYMSLYVYNIHSGLRGRIAGPKEFMSKGWELVGSRIDMDVPWCPYRHWSIPRMWSDTGIGGKLRKAVFDGYNATWTDQSATFRYICDGFSSFARFGFAAPQYAGTDQSLATICHGEPQRHHVCLACLGESPLHCGGTRDVLHGSGTRDSRGGRCLAWSGCWLPTPSEAFRFYWCWRCYSIVSAIVRVSRRCFGLEMPVQFEVSLQYNGAETHRFGPQKRIIKKDPKTINNRGRANKITESVGFWGLGIEYTVSHFLAPNLHIFRPITPLLPQNVFAEISCPTWIEEIRPCCSSNFNYDLATSESRLRTKGLWRRRAMHPFDLDAFPMDTASALGLQYTCGKPKAINHPIKPWLGAIKHPK